MKEKRRIKKGKKMKKKEEKSKTPERSFWTNLKSTYKYAKEGKKYMFLVLFATIICGVVGIITPIIGAMRIISITTSNLERLFWLIFLVLIVDIIWYGFRRLFSWSYNMYYFQVRKNIQLDMAAEVLKISQEELNNNSSGVFIDRINKDTDAITDIFTEMIDYGIELISRIGIFISIFFMNFYVGLSFLITTIVIYLVSASNSKKNAEALKKKKEKDEKQSGFTSEIVRGAKDIKILDAETSFLKRAAKLIDDTNEETFKYFDGRSKRNIIVWIMRSVATFLEWMLIYYFLINKKLTVEAAVIIINYSGRIISISNIFETILDISKKYNLAANRVFGILEENEFKKETFGNRKLKNFEGNIEFKNVKFSYEDKIPVLKGISFNIWANEKIGFVGSSGGGKTTIFNLISALNKVDSGQILFDGININELDKSSIRGNLSVISQNAYIFNMSIYDNLKIVKSNATKKEIEEACKLACLDEFINNLPDKYNTIVGEGGVTLSGGQKQRLAIARALLLKTEVILFDEATSALDNKTQAEIQKAIDNMKGEYTILIVAHRLSTVIDCDKLFVVDDGKIVATGTHKELLKKSKKYRELYERELDN